MIDFSMPVMDGTEAVQALKQHVSTAATPVIGVTAARVVSELGHEGRLVLRYSGTEPLARVMIEGTDRAQVETLARDLAGVIDQEIGAR